MSTTNIPRGSQIVKRLGLSALFWIATSLYFLGDHLQSGRDRIVATALSAILLLGLTILFYKIEKFHRYWEVTFAFFSGSFGLFLAWNIPDSPLSVFGASMYTPRGVAVLKFFELLPVALVVIVL